MDKVQTGAGRVQIRFVDNTTVKITEHSKLIIDDFVYSGKPSSSKMALKFASGTIRFATGNKIAKPNINLKTPTATIAVRGTDFTSTVDDFGKSLFILLPEEDGSVGEITVSNDAGSVVLNRAFQSTMVVASDISPSKPVILKLDLNMIDNMVIVSPPEIDEINEDVDTRKNILDLTELDIDYLKNDSLEQDNLTSSVATAGIDANFFKDELADTTNLSDSKDGISITGTTFGFNSVTQIYALIEEGRVRLSRQVGSTVDITTDSTQGKNIKIDVNNSIYNIQINEGGTMINAKQNN